VVVELGSGVVVVVETGDRIERKRREEEEPRGWVSK
jgi:hypothetical protein